MTASPPGPRGEPLFGSSRRYAKDPFRFLSACESAYGDIIEFELGTLPTYMLTNPTDIERVLVSEADSFRKPDFQSDALGDLLGEGLLLSEGETWQQQRQLTNPAFRMGRLANFADRIVDHADTMLSGWTDGQDIDVEQEMTAVTLDVIADLMLGVELSQERIETVRQSLDPLGAQFEPNPIRFAAPNWVPMPGDREYQQALDTLEGVVDDIIAERRGTEGDATAGDDADVPMDMLSILLRAQERGEQSAEQLRDEVVTMLLAGHDTTALTLTYTWYLLSEHPSVRETVHDEIDSVVDGRPTMDDVREFEYTEWVIDEAMRLYPPVYTIFREPKTDVELAGYPVKAGSALMLPQWAVHRSSRWWDNPEQFEPERWSAERRQDRPRFAYFPFGGGPRHCIGKHLAKLEAQLILARTASQFELEYAREGHFEYRPSLTVHPKDGMPMTVHER
ncbi:cytochrome P450 [Salinibaculum salinum]|uniref:cytochrome P450 n=1 Tax=Salinibaculum salinum TaxID=3131996 RepID=UPI0030ECD1FE